MGVQSIMLLGNPVLRTNCARVKKFDEPALATLVANLRDTLEDFRFRCGFGRGIAAPQIGVAQRVIVTNVDVPTVLINPLIVRHSRTTMTLWDDCFSFPELAVKVKRHLTIEVRYQDLEGKRRTLKATGAMSELLQHEIDHINGILALDRAIDIRHIVYRSEIAAERVGNSRRAM